MEQKRYKLRYLPLFVSDMEEIVDYITLQNPDEAYHFLERVEAAIWKRLEFPVSFEPYQGTGARKHPYYRIYVGGFLPLCGVREEKAPVDKHKNWKFNKSGSV